MTTTPLYTTVWLNVILPQNDHAIKAYHGLSSHHALKPKLLYTAIANQWLYVIYLNYCANQSITREYMNLSISDHRILLVQHNIPTLVTVE